MTKYLLAVSLILTGCGQPNTTQTADLTCTTQEGETIFITSPTPTPSATPSTAPIVIVSPSPYPVISPSPVIVYVPSPVPASCPSPKATHTPKVKKHKHKKHH